MRYTKLLPAILSSLCFAAAAHAQQTQVCTLNVEQSPELRGFRLGMSLNEVKSLVPEVRIYDQGFGESSTGLSLPPNNTGRFKGVRQISFRFIDEHLTSFSIQYDDSVAWQSTSQFVANISEALKLPTTWEGDGVKSMNCNGFRISAYPNNISLAVTNAEDVVRRRKAEEAERKRQSFTP